MATIPGVGRLRESQKMVRALALNSDFAFWQTAKPESGRAEHVQYRVAATEQEVPRE